MMASRTLWPANYLVLSQVQCRRRGCVRAAAAEDVPSSNRSSGMQKGQGFDARARARARAGVCVRLCVWCVCVCAVRLLPMPAHVVSGHTAGRGGGSAYPACSSIIMDVSVCV